MNTNIKGIYLFISIFLSCLMLSSLQPATAANRDEILKVYNWADYIDEDLILEFEK